MTLKCRHLWRASLVAVLVAGVAAAVMIPAAAGAASKTDVLRLQSRHVCASATGDVAACDALVLADSTGRPALSRGPAGLAPADIRAAYGLNGTSSSGRTVAIVDAYNDPTAATDLAKYRSTFGLPSCTVASGCLRVVSQTGSSRLPRSDAGWAAEISLDLDMVSATCPDCKILLVEANSASFADLGAAVNYAATQNVAAISNSYSGSDFAQLAAYNHPGIAITAATGDSGYGSGAPASFDTVIAVGGTSLTKANNARGWNETAWSGAGSLCSNVNLKPSWQTAATQCGGKGVADVSAVADPHTGVSIYDSTPYQGGSGWQIYGGTSAATPIVASIYALSGNTAGYPAAFTWAHSASLNDVTTGSNGNCTTPVWCHAGVGWDGPTGLGTPNGTSAF
jgi:subtilase family serine protease